MSVTHGHDPARTLRPIDTGRKGDAAAVARAERAGELLADLLAHKE
jgi:hypothetical protein